MTVLICGNKVQGLGFHEKGLTPRYQYSGLVRMTSDSFIELSSLTVRATV